VKVTFCPGLPWSHRRKAPPLSHLDADHDALAEVVRLLDLASRPGDDLFHGGNTQLAVASKHVFGGLVAAQATVAAHRTVAADLRMNSLHAYFLRRGDPLVPIEYRVERTRDGRSFTHRRVSAVQHGRAIMELACSFAVPEPGLRHQATMPLVPPAEELAPDWVTLAETPDPEAAVTRFGPFELRSAGTHSRIARDRGERTDHSRTWFRTHRPVVDDPVLHRALLVYATDMTVLDPTTRPSALAMGAGDVLPTTLDHAVWFHGEIRVDEWFLVDTDSPWAGDGRGFARGRVFAAAGTLTAEIAQEGLIRLPVGGG
jgi:acyl-CoA thioesterase-2